MFVLNRDAFRSVDMNTLGQFVDFWEPYYLRTNKNDHKYFDALNIGNSLTKENVQELLAWKEPRFYTQSDDGGPPNPRVAKVITKLDSINSFRIGQISLGDFQAVASQLFNSGIVMQVFLRHIAIPGEWPIADQHVFRSYAVLTNKAAPQSMAEYADYVEWFRRLADLLRRSRMISDDNEEEIVRVNKKLDSALLAFGQFLATYDC